MAFQAGHNVAPRIIQYIVNFTWHVGVYTKYTAIDCTTFKLVLRINIHFTHNKNPVPHWGMGLCWRWELVSHCCTMGGCHWLVESNGAAQPASKVNLLCFRLFDKGMHLKKRKDV